MLLVRTYLAQSPIHGLGVFAAEPIAVGTPLWRFAPGIDLVIPSSRLAELPSAFLAFLDTYGYPSPAFEDGVVLSCDHARFMNHSERPNTALRGWETLARLHIAPGDEITCDYRLVVRDWTGFD